MFEPRIDGPVYSFGEFQLDSANSLLFKDGEAISIPPKLFELLLFMVRTGDRTLSKDEILEEVWADTYVEESNIPQSIFHLRRILGCHPGKDRFIVTIPKRGYRFVRPVLLLESHSKAVVSKETKSEDEVVARRSISVFSRFFDFRPRVAFSLVTVAVVVLGFAIRSQLPTSAGGVSEKPIRSVAVLPFRAVGSMKESEHLPLAMTEGISSRLGRLADLRIQQVSSKEGNQLDAASARDNLNADVSVDGSVQIMDTNLLVKVEIKNLRDGSFVWARTLEFPPNEISAAQERLSEEISVAILNRRSLTDEQLLAKRSTTSFEAYEAYSRGRYFWETNSRTDRAKSITYFERAIRLDPNYARAYAGLADAYVLMHAHAGGANANYAKLARLNATRAIELDPSLAEPRVSLAAILFEETGDWQAAEKEFTTATELNPNYSVAHHWYSLHLLAQNEVERSEIEMRKALESAPVSPIIHLALGQIYYYTRRHEAALRQFEKAIELDPGFLRARVYFALASKELGNINLAVATLEKVVREKPDYTGALSALGSMYAESGRKAHATEILKRLKTSTSTSPLDAYGVALIEGRLGEKERTRAKLKDLANLKNLNLIIRLRLDPELDPLRDLL